MRVPVCFSGDPGTKPCRDCGDPFTGSRKRKICDLCRKRSQRRRRRGRKARRQQAMRRKAIEALGGKCFCCDVKAEEFLAVEELAGAAVRNGATIGQDDATFGRILKSRTRKAEYRLICWNCSFARAISGYCPHQRSVRAGDDQQGGGEASAPLPHPPNRSQLEARGLEAIPGDKNGVTGRAKECAGR